MPFVKIQGWNSGCAQRSSAHWVLYTCVLSNSIRTQHTQAHYMKRGAEKYPWQKSCSQSLRNHIRTKSSWMSLELWALTRFPQYSYWMLIVLCYEMALSGHTLGFIIITSRHIKRIHHLAIFNWNVGLWQVHSLAYTLEKPSGVSNFIQFRFNFQLFSHFYYSTVFLLTN